MLSDSAVSPMRNCLKGACAEQLYNNINDIVVRRFIPVRRANDFNGLDYFRNVLKRSG